MPVAELVVSKFVYTRSHPWWEEKAGSSPASTGPHSRTNSVHRNGTPDIPPIPSNLPRGRHSKTRHVRHGEGVMRNRHISSVVLPSPADGMVVSKLPSSFSRNQVSMSVGNSANLGNPEVCGSSNGARVSDT